MKSDILNVKVGPSGPTPADILIVGEAPGLEEVRQCKPFVGPSGNLLNTVLHEVGLVRADCRVTNVCHTRPPGNDISRFFSNRPQGHAWELINERWCSPEIVEGLRELEKEIQLCSPKVIVALGDTALWALTGKAGITKWRGSVLEADSITGAVIIPTYHPAAVMRMWSWRFIFARDLRRVTSALEKRPEAPMHFTILADGEDGNALEELEEILSYLDGGPMTLSLDIETRRGHIDCIGFAYFSEDTAIAVTIPFFSLNRPEGFWTEKEEGDIICAIRRIVGHRNARLILQNGLYDMQYIARHWGVYAVPHMDTMIAHAVCFPGLPKSLDFLSSLYLPYHRYWKDESKLADERMDDKQRWLYNAQDCVTTLLLAQHIQKAVNDLGLEGPLQMEMDLFEPLLHMMFRGVAMDMKLRNSMMMDLVQLREDYAAWFESIMAPALGDTQLVKSSNAKAWYDSPKQQMTLFYELLGVKPVRNRKSGKPTVDDEALRIIAKREPLLAPVCDRLADYRSLGVFLNTFVLARLDHDRRLRCSYNPVGTETFRFSSSTDVFGFGTNLQNIPAAKGE